MPILTKTCVIDVVGLTQSLIGPTQTPFLHEFQARSACREIEAAFPAVTCVAQATYLTGASPAEHSITANGFYDPVLKEVRNWHQSRALVRGQRIFDTVKAIDPTAVTFSNCGWHCMHDDALDVAVVPRPQYLSDGRKLPDIWTKPAALRDSLQSRLGRFPLHRFWGPLAGIASSQWIADASKMVDDEFDPVLSFIYLPHLDYVLQRDGPSSPSVLDSLAEIDGVLRDLVTFYEDHGARVIILSEYGIVPVNHPVHINRVLNRAGYVATRTERGGLTLDYGSSRAFAHSDHQVSIVHVAKAEDVDPVKRLLKSTKGIAFVFDRDDVPTWAAAALSVHRAGELVCVAEGNAWFTYYFWLNDADAPDYARTVAIHDKPGYDPCEMLTWRPRWFGSWIGYAHLVVKAILSQVFRLRVLINATPVGDDSCRRIAGSHGRIDDAVRPVLIVSDLDSLAGLPKVVDATAVYAVILTELQRAPSPSAA
ncbi:Alkaline phosphatase family protein [Plasmodiophora brassicae]